MEKFEVLRKKIEEVANKRKMPKEELIEKFMQLLDHREFLDEVCKYKIKKSYRDFFGGDIDQS
ncbi:MAG: hypothetical protein Q8T03_04110 [Bacteroidota bacterium]|nr:hypothetical protein [Bacteroidota bacterium]